MSHHPVRTSSLNNQTKNNFAYEANTKACFASLNEGGWTSALS